MADPLELEDVINPITALAFLALDRLYLLAGEGQRMRVFDHGGNRLLSSHSIFDSEVIHGIVCYGVSCSTEAPRSTAKLLLWGGGSIAVLEIGITNGPDCQIHVETVYLDQAQPDRILDGCFYDYHHTLDQSMDASIFPDCFLVNAHNQVIPVSLPRRGRAKVEPAVLNHIVAGPISTLYSAHIKTTTEGRVLIAAGTFFGEIIFWSLHLNNFGDAHSCTHRIFRGHQGSIHGLRISEEADNGPIQRILASCSDDRTIRIWDVSNLTTVPIQKQLQSSSESGFSINTSTADSAKCMATIMAHGSRIWGLRFLRDKGDSWGLLSYGEDANAKTWILYPKSIDTQLLPEEIRTTYELRHQMTYKYHSGKSVWSATVHEDSKESLLISTGGSDGRITSYRPKLKGLHLQSQALSCQYTIQEASRLQAVLQLPNHSSVHPSKERSMASLKQIFIALKGHWELSRTISDAIKFNSLGTFEGNATFTPRKPSSDSFDAEYLYREDGVFTDPQGLTLNANRQYVWRYEKIPNSSECITVWFVRPDGSKAVEEKFHTLGFRDLNSQHTEYAQKTMPCIMNASGHHLCEEDNYQVDYNFQLESMTAIDQWTSKFTVHGPSKDYVSLSKYKRNGQKCEESERKEAEVAIEVVNSARSPNLGEPDWKIHKGDAFKTYTWLSETEFLASTENGFILIGALNAGTEATQPVNSQVTWETIGCFPNLRSACIATSIRPMKIALLTGSEGTVYLYQHSIRRVLAVHQFPAKLAYMRAQALGPSWSTSPPADTLAFRTTLGHQEEDWQHLNSGVTASIEIGLVATCLGSSSVNVMLLRYSNGWSYSAEEIQLDFMDTFIVTSSCFIGFSKQYLILGSRRGVLAVWDLSEHSKFPRGGTILRLHDDAITSITDVTMDLQAHATGQLYFATTGRDGIYKTHTLIIDQKKDCHDNVICEVKTINECKLPFGPFIEGAYFNPFTQHMYIWGFRSTEFVVWDEFTKAEVLNIECGNAHRRWDYVVHEDGKGGGSFVFTKASLCCIYTQEGASHCVVQSGSHGREAKALALSPDFHPQANLRYLATGAEDTTIRIFGHLPADENPTLHCVSILTDHTAGIQQLRWSTDGRRLFSAAGCEEFFVWRIQQLHSIGLGVVCEARCPTVTEQKSLRIMDFNIREQSAAQITTSDSETSAFLLTMIYSDSSIRMYDYSSSLEKKFNLVFTSSYNTRCLTQIGDLRPDSHSDLHLCTASTDGSLALWRLDTNKFPTPATPTVHLQNQPWRTLPKSHEGTIKTLKIPSHPIFGNMIITGGDDGALHLTNPDPSNPNSPHPVSIPTAHATALTSLDCLGTIHTNQAHILLLATVSTDQSLKLWTLTLDNGADVGVGRIKYANISSRYTNVADPSSLGHYRDGAGRLWLFVVGIGVEVWRVRVEAVGGGGGGFCVD